MLRVPLFLLHSRDTSLLLASCTWVSALIALAFLHQFTSLFRLAWEIPWNSVLVGDMGQEVKLLRIWCSVLLLAHMRDDERIQSSKFPECSSLLYLTSWCLWYLSHVLPHLTERHVQGLGRMQGYLQIGALVL